MVDQKLEILEYDHDDLRIRLVRQRPAAVPVPVPVPLAGAGVAAAAQPAAAGTAPPGGAVAPPGAIAVKPPMMGIFYRANSPSSPPFAKKGDAVKKGQILCLVEAMKVFNEVKAEFDCVVVEVLLENGKPVKAGQDLLFIERG